MMPGSERSIPIKKKKKNYTEILADYLKNDIWSLYENDLIDNFLLGSVNLPNVNLAVKQNVVKVCYLTTSIHTLSIELSQSIAIAVKSAD